MKIGNTTWAILFGLNDGPPPVDFLATTLRREPIFRRESVIFCWVTEVEAEVDPSATKDVAAAAWRRFPKSFHIRLVPSKSGVESWLLPELWYICFPLSFEVDPKERRLWRDEFEPTGWVADWTGLGRLRLSGEREETVLILRFLTVGVESRISSWSPSSEAVVADDDWLSVKGVTEGLSRGWIASRITYDGLFPK